MPPLTFPDGFLWGAATSAHQVEGSNHNDWSEWEKAHAERLARESEQSFRWNPHWKKFEKEATDPKNYISGIACDHWKRYEEDFDILKELHCSAYRFSIEWSRIEPEEEQYDEEAIKHYRLMLLSLKRRGITPMVTLWHWTLPLWLAKRGGILAPDFPQLFARYSKRIAQVFGSEVKFWITLNEPDIYSGYAYLKGQWPPRQKSFLKYYRALKQLVRAHRAAYRTLKEILPEAQIGIAKHHIWFEAVGNSVINRFLKFTADELWNHWFLRRIRHEQDFIGLNHYNHNRIDWGYNKNENKQQTDFGWEYYPESLYHAVSELKKYRKPIYITENGIADRDDDLRPRFIREALTALHHAISKGADIRGYFHWSLLDNFEWDKGYWPRFGLVAVDRGTQERTVRPSAKMYAEICRTNALEVPEHET